MKNRTIQCLCWVILFAILTKLTKADMNTLIVKYDLALIDDNGDDIITRNTFGINQDTFEVITFWLKPTNKPFAIFTEYQNSFKNFLKFETQGRYSYFRRDGTLNYCLRSNNESPLFIAIFILPNNGVKNVAGYLIDSTLSVHEYSECRDHHVNFRDFMKFKANRILPRLIN
jgi:hypothetical protein